MSHGQATASAPATVANVAVGFDLLGHSIAGPRDRVTARRSTTPGVRITAITAITAITGSVTRLPTDPGRNTAGAAVLAWLESVAPGFGIDLAIDKGIPLSSGLGGSAASAVAALVAANALLAVPLPRSELYPFALAGEAIASGAAHGDNVGPALLGGLVLAAPDRLVGIAVPAELTCAVVHPDFELETRRAREVLREPFALSDVVAQSRNLALVLSGCYARDLDRIRAGLRDLLIEPRRAPLIPGFAAVQRAALDCGALGASISGGGPSVFGWFRDAATATTAGAAMQEAFAGAGHGSRLHISPVAGPKAQLEAAE